MKTKKQRIIFNVVIGIICVLIACVVSGVVTHKIKYDRSKAAVEALDQTIQEFPNECTFRFIIPQNGNETAIDYPVKDAAGTVAETLCNIQAEDPSIEVSFDGTWMYLTLHTSLGDYVTTDSNSANGSCWMIYYDVNEDGKIVYGDPSNWEDSALEGATTLSTEYKNYVLYYYEW